MPPKQRITREMILERSFEMFCREGMDVVNARSVAKALNCSTQPIFSYFSGMEDLKNALEEKAKELFSQAMEVEDLPGDPIVNVCCAYTRFAAEQPFLFKHLFMLNEPDPYFPFADNDERRELVQREAEATGLPYEEAAKVFVELCIYGHGLAAVRAANKAAFTPERMEEMIKWAHKLTVIAIRYYMENPNGKCAQGLDK